MTDLRKTRLTQNMRHQIIEALLRHSFAGRIESVGIATATIAENIRVSSYTKSEMDFINVAPKGWLKEANNIAINLDGQGHWVSFDPFYGFDEHKSIGADALFVFKKLKREVFNRATDYDNQDKAYHRRVPEPTRNNGRFLVTLKSHNGAAFDKNMGVREALSDDFQKAWEVANATLRSFKTFGNLFDGWPDAAPIAEAVARKADLAPKNQLPALQVADLNSIFGLPIAAE